MVSLCEQGTVVVVEVQPAHNKAVLLTDALWHWRVLAALQFFEWSTFDPPPVAAVSTVGSLAGPWEPEAESELMSHVMFSCQNWVALDKHFYNSNVT